MNDLPQESISIERHDGSRTGPYPATVTGKTVVVWDKMVDLEDAKSIVQTLPNTKERHLGVLDSTFYQGMGRDIPAHYQVSVGKPAITPLPSSVTNNFAIGGGSNVQVGDQNTQENTFFIEHMRNSIANSDASDKEKEEAFSLLEQFTAHPVISSIIGSAAWAGMVQPFS